MLTLLLNILGEVPACCFCSTVPRAFCAESRNKSVYQAPAWHGVALMLIKWS